MASSMTRMTSARSLLQHVIYKLVGSSGTPNSNFGQDVDIHDICQNKRLVFLGEIHSQPSITAFQRAVQEEMSRDAHQLHVVLEHFSFDMQSILDDYQQGNITFDQLVQQYRSIGTESHNLEPYRTLLEDAAHHNHKIRLHAGFLPRTYARMLMKQGEAVALQASQKWLPPNLTTLHGTEWHYNVFESLLTGRSTTSHQEPSNQFRGIFQAQLLKDEAMAHSINQLIDRYKHDTATKFLVICGNGHVLHHCGVPERVLKEHPDMSTCLIVSHESSSMNMEDMQDVLGSNPADYVYIFQDTNSLEAKRETRHVYDKVGESAHLEGNMKKAAAIMKSLGYTDEQFVVAGADAYNFQGVGNPHIHANIQPGDRVLDIGSGLGVDSFIAKAAAGDEGKVIGIDISEKETRHAQARSDERGLDIRFAVADMEAIPLPAEMFDVCISNGAFCLAPNKEKAFAEIFRVLKPGGRISICTSTIKADHLEPGVDWPLCMKLFMNKKDIQPMCERLGYVDVVVDESDSSMTLDLPEEVLDETNPERNKVHVGSSEFKHLEGYDMDKICARVCVVARKPLK